jgi:hypothetical protein
MGRLTSARWGVAAQAAADLHATRQLTRRRFTGGRSNPRPENMIMVALVVGDPHDGLH